MYSMLEEAKKGGNALMIGVLEKNPEIVELLGKEKVDKFCQEVAIWEKQMARIESDPLVKYLTSEEVEEYIALAAPIPTF